MLHCVLLSQNQFGPGKLDLDEIVTLGDLLYSISKPNITSSDDNYLTFDEVFQYVRIGNDIFHFNTNFETDSKGNLIKIFEGENCTDSSLFSELFKFFQTFGNNFGVFTCNKHSFAIAHIDSKFIVFDSHCRRFDGSIVEKNGTSVLCINSTLNGLVSRLRHNSLVNIQKDSRYRFSIIGVVINAIKSTDNKSEYLKIVRKLEMAEAREKKLQEDRKRKQTSRDTENEFAKRAKMKGYTKLIRSSQTPSEWRETQDKNTEKHAKSRAAKESNESPNENLKKRKIIRDSVSEADKKKQRLADLAESARLKRITESEEKRKERLEIDRERRKEFLSIETEEERKIRLEKMAIRNKAVRETETKDVRSERLATMRNTKQSKKNKSDKESSKSEFLKIRNVFNLKQNVDEIINCVVENECVENKVELLLETTTHKKHIH